MRFITIILICLLISVIGYLLFIPSTEFRKNHTHDHTRGGNNPYYVKDEPKKSLVRHQMSAGDVSDVTNLSRAWSTEQGKVDNGTALKHWRTFLLLTSTDPEAGRSELSKYAKAQYGQHLLLDEWIELTFHMRLSGKSPLPDAIRCLEIQIELLKDRGSQDTGQIETLQKSLRLLRTQGKLVRQAGGDPKTLEVDFKFEPF